MPSVQKDLEYMLKNLRSSIGKIDEAGEAMFGKREWERACEEGRRTGRFGPNPAEDVMPYGLAMMSSVEDAALTAYIVATDPKVYSKLMELSTGELIQALQTGEFLDADMLPEKMDSTAWAQARTRLLSRKQRR